MLNLVNKETETNSSTGVWIKCPSLRCGNYEWLYRGRFFYICYVSLMQTECTDLEQQN
jgi:hypothetical protein